MSDTIWFSLRRRLLMLLLGGVTALWLVTVVLSYIDVHHEIDDVVEIEHSHPRNRDHIEDERHLPREADHERDELISRIAWRLIAPALFGLPLMGAWVWFATRRALKPLATIADEIAARGPDHLSALTPPIAPEEIRPLIEAVNNLFGRVEKTLEAERRFTADAAHELRTPLAALTAQAQVVLRARDDDERRHAGEQLVASTRRATRLVDQLLTLARLDPEASVAADSVDLARLAEEVCAGHGGMAVVKNVALELDAAPATVSGDAAMLLILLRNLVDNAIRYTPVGGHVTVAVATDTGGVSLVVTDTGPGIPAAERERVFDRFRRLAGQDTEGSGLGLSIVARIAERHGATVNLGSGPNDSGLQVSLRFPLSARPAPGGVS